MGGVDVVEVLVVVVVGGVEVVAVEVVAGGTHTQATRSGVQPIKHESVQPVVVVVVVVVGSVPVVVPAGGAISQPGTQVFDT